MAEQRQEQREAVLSWLLEGDPSLRWQVLLDLTDAGDQVVVHERARVPEEGWAAQLLARQDPDGRWAGALYSPKWTSTTYTLLLLERLGLERGHPQALAGCEVLWNGARFYGGGLTLAKTVREPETCITGMLVLLAAAYGYDDHRVRRSVEWLLGQQLPDGGWNCETVRSGSRHGSFHTTITVLEALTAYGRNGAGTEVARPCELGREFLLVHRMYRSHRTGEVVDAAFTRFPFPPQWHYDVMRGLEHFRAVDAKRDDRLASAVEVVRRSRRPDGTWRKYAGYPGRQWIELEQPGPSRWSTFRALRVLDWWDARAGAPGGAGLSR